MAGTAAAKAMLIRLGLSNDAAEEITSATGQNLSEVADFADLGEDEIKRLFSSLKQPGGLTVGGTRNYGSHATWSARPILQPCVSSASM